MKVVVGLGNPGARYEMTRHNVGFIILDLLADKLKTKFNKRAFKSEIAEARVNEKEVLLVKPQTYMNLSGEALGPLVRWYKVLISDLIIVHDDLDLDIGRIRIRGRGGDGGHRGVRSLIRRLGTDEFLRVKIGIGRPEDKESAVDYVLQPFDDEQWRQMVEVIPKSVEAIMDLLTIGPDKAMNIYNS